MIKKGEDAMYLRIQLVIPKDVLARVKATAIRERRNTSNMIVALLDEAFAAREKEAARPGNSEPQAMAA